MNHKRIQEYIPPVSKNINVLLMMDIHLVPKLNEHSFNIKKSNSKKEQFRLGTEALDREKSDPQQKRLMTSSVIAKPTKSVGYINPEQFRIDDDK